MSGENLESLRDLEAPIITAHLSQVIPTGPANMHSTSKKWISPAEQSKQQRLHEQKSQRYNGPRSRFPAKHAALDEWLAVKARLDKEFPHAHSIVPNSFVDWVEHRKAVTKDRAMQVERTREALTNRIATFNTARQVGNIRLEAKAFDGKGLRGLRGAVLCENTIWTKESQPQRKFASYWPDEKEYRYEGTDRHATTNMNFHHFLPIPRDWRQELRVLQPSNRGSNYKHWEEYPRHHMFPFDYLSKDRPPSHLEVYPFGIGCPLPQCDICSKYREHFQLLDDFTFVQAVTEYQNDMANINTSRLIGSDLLAALDSDPL